MTSNKLSIQAATLSFLGWGTLFGAISLLGIPFSLAVIVSIPALFIAYTVNYAFQNQQFTKVECNKDNTEIYTSLNKIAKLYNIATPLLASNKDQVAIGISKSSAFGSQNVLVIGDNIINDLKENKLTYPLFEMILAHEMAHFSNPLQNNLAGKCLSLHWFLFSPITSWDNAIYTLRCIIGSLPWPGLLSLTGSILIYGILLPKFGLLALEALFLKSQRLLEHAADLKAIEVTKRPQDMIDCLKYIHQYSISNGLNKQNENPPKWFSSHPIIEDRINLIKSVYKAQTVKSTETKKNDNTSTSSSTDSFLAYTPAFMNKFNNKNHAKTTQGDANRKRFRVPKVKPI